MKRFQLLVLLVVLVVKPAKQWLDLEQEFPY